MELYLIVESSTFQDKYKIHDFSWMRDGFLKKENAIKEFKERRKKVFDDFTKFHKEVQIYESNDEYKIVDLHTKESLQINILNFVD